MRHHDACKSWVSFHPYDCPECKILENVGENYYSQDEIDSMIENANQEGWQDGQDDLYWEHEAALEERYDEGFKDGKQAVLDSPEDFGLQEVA